MISEIDGTDSSAMGLQLSFNVKYHNKLFANIRLLFTTSEVFRSSLQGHSSRNETP